MNLSLFAGSAFHRKYANELKTHGLEFVSVADCFASAFPDGRWFGVGNDLEKTAARMAAFSPADADTWRRLVAAFPAEAEHLFRLLGSPMTARALAGTAWNRGARRPCRRARHRPAVAFLTRAWLEENFEVAACAGDASHLGHASRFRADIAGCCVPVSQSMANQCFGMVLGKGGANPSSGRWPVWSRAGGGTSSPAPMWPRSRFRRQGDRRAARFRRDPYRQQGRHRGVAPGALPGRLLKNGSGDAGRQSDEEFSSCAGHDDDPSGAGRLAGLARRA
jgi:hypothetical protein